VWVLSSVQKKFQQEKEILMQGNRVFFSGLLWERRREMKLDMKAM
jgi:hypothetical protein